MARISGRSIAILWAAVGLTYAAVILLTDPLITMPEARRHAVFDQLVQPSCTANLDETPCNPLAEPVICRYHKIGIAYRAEYGSKANRRLSVGEYQLLRIYLDGVSRGWPASACPAP